MKSNEDVLLTDPPSKFPLWIHLFPLSALGSLYLPEFAPDFFVSQRLGWIESAEAPGLEACRPQLASQIDLN